MTAFEPGQPETTPTLTHTQVRLSGLQKALAAALEEEEDQRLLTIYQGALFVLRQTENPDRFALASHNYRELMDVILDVRGELHEVKVSLKPKVGNLRDDWDQVTSKSECLDGNGKWSGPVDKSLNRFLRRVTTFFEWFNQHHPRRKKEIAEVLKGFDPAAMALPQSLEELNVKRWENIRGYFVSVAHHGYPAEEREFTEWQYACERFLAESLRPVTFDDHANLDELIDEGEKT